MRKNQQTPIARKTLGRGSVECVMYQKRKLPAVWSENRHDHARKKRQFFEVELSRIMDWFFAFALTNAQALSGSTETLTVTITHICTK